MARKNMFEGITPAQRPEDAEIPALPRSAAKMPEVFQSAGPIAAIRNDLRSLSSRSVQEIDPEMIEDTGLKDFWAAWTTMSQNCGIALPSTDSRFPFSCALIRRSAAAIRWSTDAGG